MTANVPTQENTYTGPNDPNGKGPQDGFGSATEQSNLHAGSKPAVAYFKNKYYAAFLANDSSNELYVSSASSGTLPAATGYTDILMAGAPAMAVFNGQLYVAFRGLDVNNDFYITSLSIGTNFPAATQHTNIQMGSDPALTVFNNQLCATFQANDAGHTLHITCSSDGTTWPAAAQVANVAVGSTPSMDVLGNKLYVAFKANDSSNDVWIASSSDGKSFASQVLKGQQMGWNSSPVLVTSNYDTLYLIYGANDTGNENVGNCLNRRLNLAGTRTLSWCPDGLCRSSGGVRNHRQR